MCGGQKMELFSANLKHEYQKDKNLNEKSVQALMESINAQPHLPKIDEMQAIIFLKRCDYQVETAKLVIDSYFTTKTLCSDLFLNRNPSNLKLKEAYDLLLYTILPKTTDGKSIVFVKMINPDMNLFDVGVQIKYLDMVCMLVLYQDGASRGYELIVDLKDFPIGILSKLDPLIMKKFLYYMQEVMPLRWTGIHYFNVVPFMDQLLSFIKSFMSKDFIKLIHLHDTVDDLTKHIPKECLPEDYGGSVDNTHILHEKIKSRLLANAAFFAYEDTQLVDESKRPGKPKTINDIFGIEATFRKLQLD